jgi:hypothetical protein
MRLWPILFWCFLWVIVLTGSGRESMAAELPSASGRFFGEVTNEFKTMTTTRYQHKTQVDRKVGSYQYDCVGFVSYALQQSAPQAWASVVSVCGIRKGYFPSPPLYQRFFTGLAETPQPGWQGIAKVSELRPGDIVSWDLKTKTAVGHAIVIASIPRAEADGVWVVEVYDSTAAPHLDDSRSGDSRAQAIQPGGRRSGLGHGVMALIADPVSGTLIGHRWSPKAKTIIAPTAAGRPTS